MSARLPRILVLEALSGGSDCMLAAGAETIECLPNRLETIDEIDKHDWDGLLLTGGGDVDPRMYGQRPRSEVYGVSENRDLVETYALSVAEERGVPVLGICRGCQLINVFAGGTLRQHIEGHRSTSHHVVTTNNSIFRRVSGKTPKVISLHHQRIEKVARGYSVSGHANDRTIEAVESDDGRVVGVQFHPEMDQYEDYAQGLFRWLVEEASDRAGLPRPPLGELPYEEPKMYYPKKSKDWSRNMRVMFTCPHCAMKFDGPEAHEDRDLHVEYVHGGSVVVAEPVGYTDAEIMVLSNLSDEEIDELSRQGAFLPPRR